MEQYEYMRGPQNDAGIKVNDKTKVSYKLSAIVKVIFLQLLFHWKQHQFLPPSHMQYMSIKEVHQLINVYNCEYNEWK